MTGWWGRALGAAWLLAALLGGMPPGPALAESPVAIGAPLSGEAVLNRDVEVRIGPSQEARIIMTLQQGKVLNALDTPRGTSWTKVAIGGQPIGYVPSDSLDPALMITGRASIGGATAAPPKPAKPGEPAAAASGRTAAVVPKAAWDLAAQVPAQGYVVASRPISATEILDNRKRRGFTLRKGDVVGLLDVSNGQATLTLPGRTRAIAPVDGLIGVVAPYPLPGMPPLEPGMLYAVKLGQYLNHAEGMRAWQSFAAGPGAAYRELPPMVWPVFRGGRALYDVGVGPFTRLQVDGVCGTLAQRGIDCNVIELETF
ncbi:SH3 domain-containing protein [Azospirillum thermophilum]|nr:SH3 domain-containing protein [Azospirillum thermophilum]